MANQIGLRMYEQQVKPQKKTQEGNRQDARFEMTNKASNKHDKASHLQAIAEAKRLQALANERDTKAWQQPEPGLGTVSILGLLPTRAMQSGLYQGGASLFGAGVASGGSVGAMRLVSFGANAGTKLRKHSQHIRETARLLGIDIPKGPSKPETRAAIEEFITFVVVKGKTVSGRYMSIAEAQWSRLGDAVVVRRMNGEFITFLDAAKKGAAQGMPGGL